MLRRLRVAPATAAVALAWAPLAFAQQPPPQPVPGAAQPQPAPAPPSGEPPRPSVSDPMLAPPPPAHRLIATWDDAYTLLRARSTDLRIAYDEVRKAEGQSRVALAGTLPTLSARGTATHIIYSSSSTGASGATTSTGAPGGAGRNSLQGSVTFAQPLIDVRAWHAIGTAHVGEAAAQLSYDDLRRTTAANLASAIVSAVTAERVAELNRVGLRDALERLELTNAKERTGTASGLDVVRARQDVANARSAVVSGDEALLQAREALGLALGIPEQIGVVPNLDLSSIERDALHSCKPVGNLEDRADVAALRKRLEISKRNVTDVWLGFLPTLTAQSTLSSTLSDAGGGPRTTWDISAVLSIPIWDGGARYGERRIALAQEDESAQQLTALRRDASIAVTQARRAVDVAQRSRDVAEEARNLAATVDKLTISSYRTGKGTSLDLVVSAAALRQAEISLAVQEFALVRTRIEQLLALATCSP